jgi:hypothetical protein
VWEYAVLPVLVSARLLVSLLGDFDLFASANAPILPGGVTAQSQCWYDMSYGSRTRAHRWVYVWLLHVILRFGTVAHGRLFIAFHVKESREMNNNGPPPRPDATEPVSLFFLLFCFAISGLHVVKTQHTFDCRSAEIPKLTKHVSLSSHRRPARS